MSEKLFNPVQEGHDPQGRPVFICQDKAGFHVYKPRTGFTSKYFKKQDDPALQEIFEYQTACGQNNAFYRKGDKGRGKLVQHPAAAPAATVAKIEAKGFAGPASTSDEQEIYTV